MSKGPSIKNFSNYLSKTYKIPHASTLTNSTIDAQDPGSHPPKPTEPVENQQSRQGSSHAQERQDASPNMSSDVLEVEGDKTSLKVREQLQKTIKDSDEFFSRSNDLKSKRDKPVEVQNGTADDKQRQSDGEKTVKKNQRDKLADVKQIYPQERKDSECQSIGANDKKNRQERQSGTNISQPEALRKDEESQSNGVNIGRTDIERDVHHVPTVVEHVLQNRTDVSSRSSLSDKGTKSQGGTAFLSLTALDELSCSMKIDEELLSSSYDHGLVRTFGRGDLDGPIAHSTLRSALEDVEEKTELWTTVVPQGSIDDKTEMWSDSVTDKTEPWKVGTKDCTNEVKAALEKTVPWTDETMTPDGKNDDWLSQTATKNVGEMQRILLQPKNLNSPCKVPFVINSASKVPFEMKPVVEDSFSDKHSVNDKEALTGNILDIRKCAGSTPSLSLLLKEPNVDLLENKSETNSKSKIKVNSSSQNEDGRKLEIIKKKKSKAEKADFRRSPSKLEEIKCKRCQLELSTREALKMHTCYSIMDKLIQSDGGTRRRNSSSGENKSRVTPSVDPASRSDTKTKPKKKVNVIMAIKDDKLAKGEILLPYILSKERMEEQIENDRVDEEQTTLVSPRLKKGNQVFNLNPPVLHKIKDKPKDYGSRLFVNPSPVKLTTEPIKGTNVKLASETNNPVTAKLITKSIMSSAVSVETTIDTFSLTMDSTNKITFETPVPSLVESTMATCNASTNELITKLSNSTGIKLAAESGNSSTAKLETEKNEADGVFDSFKTADLDQNIIKTKPCLKISLPKQSLSQLKTKAESEHLTFKRRYYRTSVEIAEKEKVNSEEKVHTRDQDHSSQKRSDLPTSNYFHQKKYEHNSTAIKLAAESGNSSTAKLETEKNEADGVFDCFKTADLDQNINKIKHCLKVNLPKQSLSQLKTKAESQHLTFKRRYYRTSVEIAEKGKVNSEEKAHTKDQDHSSQKRSDLPTSNDLHQKKLEHKEKRSDDKSVRQKKTGGDSENNCREKHLDEKSVVQKKTGIDGEHKVREKCVNHKKVKDVNEHEHERREKYSNEKAVEQKKTGEEYDSKKKREHFDKRDGMEKSNKMFKEELSSKSEKHVFGKDDTVGRSNKLIGNMHKERKIVSLGKKDSTTKVSTEGPPKNIVNHFEAYNPHLHSEDSPQRKRHKSDKTPSSHKERSDRKVKSEERHSRKNKLKSSPCKSVSSPIKFKIPKYNGDKPPKKVKGFAPAKFLQNENIKTLAVGESGSSLLNSLLSDIKGDSTKAIEMFDKIDSKQNKMAKNNRYEAKEAKERSDIIHEGWDQVKNAKDDNERKKLSEQEFGNPVPNHPNYNLSYHGYKRHKSGSPTDRHPLPATSVGFWDNSKNMPMYHLTNGAPTPLPGYTFKHKPSDDQLQLSCEENKEKLKLDDFVTLMKAVMYNKKAKKEGMGDDRKLMEEFETFLGHYKAGQEETTHFLEFYQNQGQVELEGWQAIQIMDLENQFSTFQGYYGLTDELSCVTCNKKHTFAL